MTTLPSVTLNDGHSIPALGFGVGTAWSKGATSEGTDRALVDAIKTAIKLGFTHLDGAEVYNTEHELGIAIKESQLPREKLFVTTKVFKGVTDIPKAFAASLKKLGLDYVDLYLIHAPFFAESSSDLQNAWKAMEEIKQSGRAKSIGVSNYAPSHLASTLEKATIPPVINQVEFHPYLQRDELVAFHHDHGILTEAYGPLTALTKASPGPTDEVIARIAQKYGVSEGAVTLRWCLDQNIVAVTTSGKEERLKEYLQATTFTLSPDEIAEIDREGAKKHFRGFWRQKFDANDRS
ncbi:MAG: hypothetical protein M1838_002022 [Thelocarpon superellum]|nr:MAG: hypothetical protein M1838_002022 [Thelocarpon superellum]